MVESDQRQNVPALFFVDSRTVDFEMVERAIRIEIGDL